MPPDQAAALARVRFRRALTLLVMTLVLPGTAQLVAGNKRVGRIALRVLLALLGALGLLVLIGLVRPGFVYWLLSNTVMLGFIRLLLCALAIGWAGLFVDAWRIGQPLELMQKQRLVMVASAAGDSSAAPTPWATRPPSSMVWVCARPVTSEARVKITRPVRIIGRVPTRSANRPPSSSSPPKTSP